MSECYLTCLASGANGSGHSFLYSAEKELRPKNKEAVDTDNDVDAQTSRVLGRCLINCGDCTQRTVMDNRIKLSKVSSLWLTSLAPHHTAGLAGILLSLSDLGTNALTVVGPPGTSGLLSVMVPFTNRLYPQVQVIEIGLDEEGTGKDSQRQPRIIYVYPFRISAYAIRTCGRTVAIAGVISLYSESAVGIPLKVHQSVRQESDPVGTNPKNASPSLILIAAAGAFPLNHNTLSQSKMGAEICGSPALSIWSPISSHCRVNQASATRECISSGITGIYSSSAPDETIIEQLKAAVNVTAMHSLAQEFFPPVRLSVRRALSTLTTSGATDSDTKNTEQKHDLKSLENPRANTLANISTLIQSLETSTLQVGMCVRSRVSLTARLVGHLKQRESYQRDHISSEDSESDSENSSKEGEEDEDRCVVADITTPRDSALHVAQKALAKQDKCERGDASFQQHGVHNLFLAQIAASKLDGNTSSAASSWSQKSSKSDENEICIDDVEDRDYPCKRTRLEVPPPPVQPPPPPPPMQHISETEFSVPTSFSATQIGVPQGQRFNVAPENAALGAVRVTLLGTGCARPSRDRNSLSTMLWMPGAAVEGHATGIVQETSGPGPSLGSTKAGIGILLDCGEGTACQIFQACSGIVELYYKTLCSVRMIWISHHHADHSQGVLHLLEEVQRARKSCATINVDGSQTSTTIATVLDVMQPIAIIAAPDALRYYEYAACAAGLEDLCSLIPIGNTAFAGCGSNSSLGHLCQNTLYHMTSVPVQHCKDSYAVVLRLAPSGDATNAMNTNNVPSLVTIAFSGDCRPSDMFVKVGNQCDLLIHEATYGDDMAQTALERRHCTQGEALAVGRRMRAKHVILTHFSQRYPMGSTRRDKRGSSQADSDNGAATLQGCSVGYDLLGFWFPKHIELLPIYTQALAVTLNCGSSLDSSIVESVSL